MSDLLVKPTGDDMGETSCSRGVSFLSRSLIEALISNSASFSAARAIAANSSSSLTGFVRKSIAPAFMARTVVGTSPTPVIKMTGRSVLLFARDACNSRPSRPGIATSNTAHPRQQGAVAALRILQGEKPRTVDPPSVLFGQPVYDSRELQRWGISEARLPPDSIVHFRQPTLWEQYRWPITAVAAIIPLQSLLIGYVLIQDGRRRKAEAEAAQQRQEVAHLMRVSVLGELSGSIAHKINQPLTAILSNAQAALHLLAQKSPNLEEIRDALKDIVDEDNRAGEVINRLRRLLKKGERMQKSVDINDLVRSTAALLHSELVSREITVKLDLGNRVLATGDNVQLQQVLLNLVMNAMDAMVSTPKSLREVLISTREIEDGAIEVMVKDRGHGSFPRKAFACSSRFTPPRKMVSVSGCQSVRR